MTGSARHDSPVHVPDRAHESGPYEQGVESLFAGPGEMRAHCRALDWGATSLGPVDGWPQSLRTMCSLVLGSGFPAILLWGPGLVQLHNDAYIPFLGVKHPGALGVPSHECWPEIWHKVEPILTRVLGGETVTLADQHYPLLRREHDLPPDDVYITLTYVPVRTETGAVGGVLVTGFDTTAQVRARQGELESRARVAVEAARERITRLYALLAALSSASTLDEVADAVVSHSAAVFGAVGVVIARLREEEEQLEIMQVSHLADSLREAWRVIPLQAPVPLSEVVLTRQPLFLESRAAWAKSYPHLEPLLETTGHHANAIVPLIVQGRVLGALGVAFDAPRTFSEDERDLAIAVAGQCALALERAELYEAERAARSDAEAANRSKSEFLAVISHELRTPLNAIGGYAELMELGVHGPVTSEQRTALARIQNSQRHLLGLINGVLNYSRIEAGALHYELVNVPLIEVLSVCEALVAPQARSKQIALRVMDAPERLSAYADREKLQQILLNLLSNAIKFSEAGGTVTIAAESGGSATVIIRVSDTGWGIAHDDHERVFQPFVQLEARPARTQEGTGLGLAISRDLARGMGGGLALESEVGVGSTFTLTLPAARGLDEAPEVR